MKQISQRYAAFPGVLTPLLIALALSGCAGKGKKPPVDESAMEAAVKAVADTDGKRAAEASKAEDKYKIYPGTGVLVKPPAAIPVKTGGGNVSLNFEGADIREVVRTILGDILRENYLIDPRVGGTIVLRTTKPIPQSAVLPTLEEVIRMNGAALIREADGVYHIVPANLAGKGNLTPQLTDLAKPLPSGFSIQVVPLKFIGATDMAKMLEPLAETGSVRADPLRNLLIIAGTQTQLRHLLETVDMFDVDWISGMSVGLFPLQNVEVKTLITEMDKLFGEKAAAPWAGALRIVPIERLNALLIVTPQAQYLEKARAWIERLDRGGAGGGGMSLFVYAVQNGKAEHMAEMLNQVFSKQKSATKSASVAPGLKPTEITSGDAKATSTSTDTKPVTTASSLSSGAKSDALAVSDGARVIADKDNNALLILATAAEYETIETAIRKLDVVPRQVLIEVTIAEISLKDELSYGLEWYLSSGSKVTGKLDTGSSGIEQLVPGLSVVQAGKDGAVKAILNTLAKDEKVKVLSSPHITVADNQTAKIQVGDKVPTISQVQAATTTTGLISSVQYLETGVMLEVTPRVNAGGLVGLEIKQEVSNAYATDTSTIDSPTIKKRSAESTVTVRSGETLVLAGLIKEEKTNGSTGVPGLSRIPLVGGLFGTQTLNDNRTELIILITPKVMETVKDASEITHEYRKRLVGLEKLIKDVGIAETLAPIEPRDP